ncbi:MAG: 7,8-didemethyl-8-hydroxy-5-deazariboflavin synthase subunit CofG [Synechococcales bacterium]|nr:7,8-didemethyl-8-hydroxy-5-deazariboflavin synthase subunit CofG [Synechococcales bacterium]
MNSCSLPVPSEPAPSPPARTITYSPAYTLVPTYECFNRCRYCNFRTDIGTTGWLSLAEAETRLRSLPATVKEILILSGEVHPQSPQRSAWLEHIYQICQLALALGFFPHTNVGPLSRAEMTRLKSVNVSMGLMIEQVSDRIQPWVHRHTANKAPNDRLKQLSQAGQLQIPFTTGLLLGLGETAADRIAGLQAIADLQAQYGHLQECILQPYSPGQQEAGVGEGFPLEQLPEFVAIARALLPASIILQIPPNLVARSDLLLACLAAGARDLGGISPIDEVNPDYPHPTADQLRAILEPAGWQLVPRLPVHSHYLDWVGL